MRACFLSGEQLLGARRERNASKAQTLHFFLVLGKLLLGQPSPSPELSGRGCGWHSRLRSREDGRLGAPRLQRWAGVACPAQCSQGKWGWGAARDPASGRWLTLGLSKSQRFKTLLVRTRRW